MSMSRLCSIAVLAVLITACGQKGPLVLPDGAKPRGTASTQPGAASPSSEQQSPGQQSSKQQSSDGKPADNSSVTPAATDSTTTPVE
jgi:predicted small lipoprotein YifL